MALFADVAEEFKSATPGGKALMVVAIIAVAGLGIYVYKQKTASSGATTGGTLVPIDTSSGGTATTGTGTTTTTSKPVATSPAPTTPVKVFPGGSPNGPPHLPLPPQSGQYVTVTAFPGQLSTLWGIAQAKYGNGALWNRIAQANNIHGTTIYAGQKLWIPK